MHQFALQAGQQMKFGSCPADFAIYGGAAGGGKSVGLIYEGCRNIHIPGYNGILFRRETTDLRDGGLWDEAYPLFHAMGCKTKEQSLRATYPDGGFLKMSHLQYERDKYGHQGKQYGFIGFDELTQFTESQVFYMQTRNRSTVVNPYMRGTCNPDPDSFLVNGKDGWGSGLISWHIDSDGYPIDERDGVIRWMYKIGDEYDFAMSPGRLIDRHYDTLHELFLAANEREHVFTWERFCKHAIKSVTFIRSNINDNPALLSQDPGYLATLNTQDRVTRERLLKGNWRVKQEGSIFKESMFKQYEAVPYLENLMIFADTAQSTKETAAYTVFLLCGYNNSGIYVLDIVRGRFDVDELKEEAIAFWKKHQKPVLTNRPPFVMRVENKSSGIGLNQQLNKANIPIEPIERGGKLENGDKAPGSKWERAMNSVYALNGRPIHVPKVPTSYSSNISWVNPFISELLAAEKHGDKKGYWDQVDTFSDAVTEFYLQDNVEWAV